MVASAEVPADKTSESFTIENVHLWNGRKDPHLYTAVVTLKRNGEIAYNYDRGPDIEPVDEETALAFSILLKEYK